MPSEPASTEASSERMSPNMLPVTMTSKEAGLVMSDMAVESTRRCSSSTSGYSGATSSTTVRQSRLEASTLALSTLVRRLRRPRASSKARRDDAAHLALGVDHRVVGLAAVGAVVRLAALAEVDVTGELADDHAGPRPR